MEEWAAAEALEESVCLAVAQVAGVASGGEVALPSWTEIANADEVVEHEASVDEVAMGTLGFVIEALVSGEMRQRHGRQQPGKALPLADA